MSENFGERIKAYRKKHGLRQDELAHRLGITRNYVSMIEGGREPSEQLVRSFAMLERSPLAPEITTARIAEEPPEFSAGARTRLRHAREAAGLSIEQLAKQIRCEPGFLRALEEGSAPITEKFAKRLCRYLSSLEEEELLGGSETAKVIDITGRTGTYGAVPNITLPRGKTARYVPRLSYTQAGAMHEWTDDLYEHEGILAMDLPPRARAFSVCIRGDSMEPKLLAGDDVVVLWGVEPRNGQVVVACTTSGEVMCKIYSVHDRGERIVLSSYNALHHPPIELHREELRWVYPVHSVNRVLQP